MAKIKTKEEVQELLDTLINSCIEGQTGEWDASEPNGHDGFEAMILLLEDIKEYIKTA